VDLDGGTLAARSGHDRVQHGADFDLGLLAGVDGAVDEEGEVGANDLGDIELERLAVAADGAAGADGARRRCLIGLVEGPQAERQRRGVLRCQREKVLDECIRPVLVEKGSKGRIIRPSFGGDSGYRREKIVTGKGEVVRQGKISGMDAVQRVPRKVDDGIRAVEC